MTLVTVVLFVWGDIVIGWGMIAADQVVKRVAVGLHGKNQYFLKFLLVIKVETP
ncbi:hypothetical protein IV64_GL000967 [Lactiplantibacillus xiangfangensis]|uniref:Uncharacterized protein n=1 Tax=Lactiplantibacillus xiangfangensis TaxID=942150 RepID=A0A0R2MLQ1_9LACO|nr:hypothetical protein IV64_GL000967 [Lactiplantibacillus xiangfangensis]